MSTAGVTRIRANTLEEELDVRRVRESREDKLDVLEAELGQGLEMVDHRRGSPANATTSPRRREPARPAAAPSVSRNATNVIVRTSSRVASDRRAVLLEDVDLVRQHLHRAQTSRSHQSPCVATARRVQRSPSPPDHDRRHRLRHRDRQGLRQPVVLAGVVHGPPAQSARMTSMPSIIWSIRVPVDGKSKP